MKYNYNHTARACFLAYIVQAIVNNYLPLLFLTFNREYNLPLSQITLLVTINFGFQLLIDVFSVYFIEKIGYRTGMVLAHLFATGGLVLLTILPDLLPSAFLGILISVLVYAVGGGLLEVLVSPVVEACPSDNKEKTMSLLHSFYCFGHVGVVLVSTLFFHFFGIDNWKILALLWAVVPLLGSIIFLKVPIAPLLKDGETSMGVRGLLRSKMFWILFVMMICAGASEQAVGQWSSTLMESSLGVSKTVGDLAGPMAFAVCMGLSRAFYGKYGDKISLDRFMIFSCVLAIVAYSGITVIPLPIVNTISLAICGVAVGIMWPGTFSTASSVLSRGGTAMFALLALGGDIGCTLGPTLVGFVSSASKGDLKSGILFATVFPLLLLSGTILCIRRDGKKK